MVAPRKKQSNTSRCQRFPSCSFLAITTAIIPRKYSVEMYVCYCSSDSKDASSPTSSKEKKNRLSRMPIVRRYGQREKCKRYQQPQAYLWKALGTMSWCEAIRSPSGSKHWPLVISEVPNSIFFSLMFSHFDTLTLLYSSFTPFLSLLFDIHLRAVMLMPGSNNNLSFVPCSMYKSSKQRTWHINAQHLNKQPTKCVCCQQLC